MRHVAAPELPYAGRRESRDTRACTLILSFVLIWSLYAWVSGLQDIDIHAVQQHGAEAVDGLIMASVLDAPVDELDTQNLWKVERELGNKKLAKSYIC
jgi:hypothetical protein